MKSKKIALIYSFNAIKTAQAVIGTHPGNIAIGPYPVAEITDKAAVLLKIPGPSRSVVAAYTEISAHP